MVNHLRWKIIKEGFEEVRMGIDVAFTPDLHIPLTPENSGPAGMVFVPKGKRGFPRSDELEGYWIDRYEVTNRQYKEFIDAGGYRKREYWKPTFVSDGQEVGWEQGVKELVDRTGRPGPSTWKLGAYPEGQADYPVSGVSWYEAAAYAEYAGRSLPTIHHWERAAGYGIFSDILDFSNFDNRGPAQVGGGLGIGPYGTYDMAGNVKEWCSNEAGGHRFILGGTWKEPREMFKPRDARPPFARQENHGFRCVKYISPPSRKLTQPVEMEPAGG